MRKLEKPFLIEFQPEITVNVLNMYFLYNMLQLKNYYQKIYFPIVFAFWLCLTSHFSSLYIILFHLTLFLSLCILE